MYLIFSFTETTRKWRSSITINEMFHYWLKISNFQINNLEKRILSVWLKCWILVQLIWLEKWRWSPLTGPVSLAQKDPAQNGT